MGVPEDTGRVLAAKFGAIFPHLDERQRQLPAIGARPWQGKANVRLGWFGLGLFSVATCM